MSALIQASAQGDTGPMDQPGIRAGRITSNHTIACFAVAARVTRPLMPHPTHPYPHRENSHTRARFHGVDTGVLSLAPPRE